MHRWRIVSEAAAFSIRRCPECGLFCRVRFSVRAGRRVEIGSRRYLSPEAGRPTTRFQRCGAPVPAPAPASPRPSSPRVEQQRRFRRFWRPRLEFIGVSPRDYERAGRKERRLLRAVALILWSAHRSLAALPETRFFIVRSQLDPARAYQLSRRRRRPAAE